MKKILTFLFIFHSFVIAQKAVIVVPVADLTGQPLANFYGNQKSAEEIHKDLPFAAIGKMHSYACPRLHQALCNEVVELIDCKGKEARIRIHNLFYKTTTSDRQHRDYWTLKKNLITFNDLKQHGVSEKHIPTPTNFLNPNADITRRDSTTLIHPFFDPKTKQTYSAGTRFIKTQQQLYKDKISVYVFDPKIQKLQQIIIPRKYVYTANPSTPQEYMQEFVSLLRTWTTSGTYPYVWGGCSLTQSHNGNKFSRHKTHFKNAPVIHVHRSQTSGPKGGIDCAGLIARAAQIVGIPYFYKNSYTIAQHLSELKSHQRLKEGDIIWIYGHVMVVANRKKNSIIEARHYEHGYGKVHEIPLAEQFKNMHSFADLESAFFNKKPLHRLDSSGKHAQTYHQFKLLKLDSVWT